MNSQGIIEPSKEIINQYIIYIELIQRLCCSCVRSAALHRINFYVVQNISSELVFFFLRFHAWISLIQIWDIMTLRFWQPCDAVIIYTLPIIIKLLNLFVNVNLCFLLPPFPLINSVTIVFSISIFLIVCWRNNFICWLIIIRICIIY